VASNHQPRLLASDRAHRGANLVCKDDVLHEILHDVIWVSVHSFLILMMLALGLSIDHRDLWRSLRRPLIGRGLLVALIAVPLLAIAVVAALPLGPYARGVILLMAVCPGCPLLLLPVRRQEGNMSDALALSLVLTLAAIVFLPLSLAVLRGLFPVEFHVTALGTLGKVAPPIVIPLTVGLAVRAIAPKLAARIAPITIWLFKAALLVLLVVVLLKGLPLLEGLTMWDLVAMLLVTTGAAVIGQLAAGAHPADRSLLATTAVYGNPMMVLFVAHVSYPQIAIMPVVVLYVILRAVALLPYKQWARRHPQPAT
jgi:BASS family bile acid:Na+ symporter